MMKRILLIHNYYRYRGGEDRYVNILEHILTGQGHSVIRFFSDSRDIGDFHLLKKCLIPFRMIRSSAADKKLDALIKREKPALAIVHNLSPLFSPAMLKVLKKNKVPVLKRLENFKFLCLNGLFLRNNFVACEVCKFGNFFPGIVHRCYQRSFISSLGMALAETIHRRKQTIEKNTCLFLATSAFVKSRFVEAGFPGERIEVLPNFIDFQPLDAPKTHAGYAIYVGRLSKEKGLLTLLEAFKDLPGLPLKILGEGPLESELKEYAEKHKMNHVSFEGFIDGPLKREKIAHARFLVFPSECYESFGYSIVEGFACGVPVLASDIGSAREPVESGKTGFLFKPGDAPDLKCRIQAMLEDPENLEKMRHNALDKAKRLYTKETGVKNLETLFHRLLNREGGRA